MSEKNKNMNRSKKVKRIIIILEFLILGIYLLLSLKKEFYFTKYFIKKNMDIDISNCQVINSSDTLTSFNGDGTTVVVFDCNDAELHFSEKWKPLPLSYNIKLMMYGGKKDGITYTFNLSEKNNIPEIEDGYYYFEDRFDKDNSMSDEEIFNRNSFNFTLIMYDVDNKYLYYMEFDT